MAAFARPWITPMTVKLPKRGSSTLRCREDVLPEPDLWTKMMVEIVFRLRFERQTAYSQ